jgi:hypothetical protein
MRDAVSGRSKILPYFHSLWSQSIMSRFLSTVIDGLVWGFTMAVGWFAAVLLIGAFAA